MSKLHLSHSKESKEKDKKRKVKLNLFKGHPIEIINVSTNQKTIYFSIRQAQAEAAASELGIIPISIKIVLTSKKTSQSNL